MGSKSGHSPLMPAVARMSSTRQDIKTPISSKPFAGDRRKSEYFAPDCSASKTDLSSTSSSSPKLILRNSPSFPMSAQLELLRLANDINFYNENCKKCVSTTAAAIDKQSLRRPSSPNRLKELHETLTSKASSKELADSRRRSAASFVEKMQNFSSAMNEKLLKKKQRSSRDSLGKSTISSHDSGIGMMQDDFGFVASPVGTPTTSLSDKILNTRVVVNHADDSNGVSPSADVWFGSSTPILKYRKHSKQATTDVDRYGHFKSSNNLNDDASSIDVNNSPDQRATRFVDYDTETLRRSAQKNREIAAKLLPKLNQRSSPREAFNGKIVQGSHERQVSIDSQNSNGKSPRLIAKSPSQISFSGSSSIFTENSNGTSGSSGGGSEQYRSLQRDLITYHDEQQDLMWRAVSIDTLRSELGNVDDEPLVKSYLNNFNQPHQRTNIASLVSAAKNEPVHFDRKKCRENNQAHLKKKYQAVASSMPNLNSDAADDSEQKERAQNNLNTKGTGVHLKRCESPVYSVPVKVPSDKLSSGEMKTAPPPPLAKKPALSCIIEHHRPSMPPCQKNLPDCCSVEEMSSKTRTAGSSTASSSTVANDLEQCAVNGIVHGGRRINTGKNDKLTEDANRQQQRCDDNSVRCTNDNSNRGFVMSNGSGGHRNFDSSNHWPLGRYVAPTKRPVVPVHPYNEQNLVIGTNYHQNEDAPIKSSSAQSPRPPVPPKPDKIVVAKPAPSLPPKPTTGVQQKSQEIVPKLALDDVDCNVRMRHTDDDEMTRRSRIVAENSNDAGLIDILVGQQRQSVDFINIVFDRKKTPQEHNNQNTSQKLDQNFNGKQAGNVQDVSSTQNGAIISNASTKKSKEMEMQNGPFDIEKEKRNLISSLSSKLAVLKKMLREVEQEMRYNDTLGQNIRTVVETSDVSAHDKDSFRLHVEDTEKITHLLLKLSAQLARVENDLNRMPITCSPKEKQHLSERRQRLMVQLQDAKCLKEDLDRRGELVMTFLCEHFDCDQLADYQYFIQMKSQLLIDAREIEDKIKLGEDQQKALESSLLKS